MKPNVLGAALCDLLGLDKHCVYDAVIHVTPSGTTIEVREYVCGDDGRLVRVERPHPVTDEVEFDVAERLRAFGPWREVKR